MFEGRVAKGFEAMDHKDVEAVMRGWADDGVFEYPGHSTLSGRMEGKPAIEAFMRALFERLDTWHFTIKHVALANPLGLAYTNTIFVEWDVDETSKAGIAAHNSGVTVFTYRRGKLVAARDYIFDTGIVDQVIGTAERRLAA